MTHANPARRAFFRSACCGAAVRKNVRRVVGRLRGSGPMAASTFS